MKHCPIPGYEYRYDIYEDGRIVNVRTGRAISKRLKSNGYYIVTLWKNNKPVTRHLHRLLAEVFLPNSEKLPTVNHIDGNKTNNDLSNLEWVSYSENIKHAYGTGLKKSIKGKPQRGKMVRVSNLKFSDDVFCNSAVQAANLTGVPLVSVYRVLHGKRASIHGFTFTYVEGEITR